MPARTVARFRQLPVMAPLLLVTILLLTGCAAPRMREPVRAIWVTRFDYKAPADVTRIVEDCAQAGFNTIMFQVRGNGTAFYCSKYEPWAQELGGADPGWDPLALACQEAHARKLELHAWVNVMPAWRGPEPPADPNQLYNAHADWFWYDTTGARQPLIHQGAGKSEPWYVSVNPCLPEVRAYLVDVFRDLVARYDVDGLHLDYIRFPNEPVVTGEKVPDYPRDGRTLALFKQATGHTPDEDSLAWDRWRTEQVTRLVRDVRDMVRRTKPRIVLTAALGSVPANALRHFQDGIGWRDAGLIDAALIMNYVDGPEKFARRLAPWLERQPRDWLNRRPRVPVVPGLWFGAGRRSTEQRAIAVRQQIEKAREATGNFCMFAYAQLFDSPADREPGREVPEQRAARHEQLEALRPFLLSIAQQDEAAKAKGAR